jgi:hypothetical protein
MDEWSWFDLQPRPYDHDRGRSAIESLGAATGDLVGTVAEPPTDLLVGFAVAAVLSGFGLAVLVGRLDILVPAEPRTAG